MEDIRNDINRHINDKVRVENVYSVISKLLDMVEELSNRIDLMEKPEEPEPEPVQVVMLEPEDELPENVELPDPIEDEDQEEPLELEEESEVDEVC